MTIARRTGTRSFCRLGILLAVLGFVLLPAMRVLAQPAGYLRTDLVSDQPGIALIQDPTLSGAWGIALSPTGGAFWVSSNGHGVSDLYTGDVNGSPFSKVALTVSIPGGLPTGLVFNPLTTGADFSVTNGVQSGQAIFIFASAGGDITGWNPAVMPATTARLAFATVTGAVYTGLAIGANASGNFLYAADFENGKVDVFDGSFQLTTLAGSFIDPDIPGTYRPFNIQNLGGELYVTYAIRDGDGDGVPNGGAGFVSVFDTNGNFLQRLITGGGLRAPWGLALAPASFGSFSNALLVGNFGSGRINAYDPDTGVFLGQLRDAERKPIAIDGLLGLAFGNGVSAGDQNALYFAAGPDGLTHGLFGSLRVIP